MATDPLFDLSGKVAVVTGGSRGIGEMIARGFVERGVRTYITSRKADVCAETAAELQKVGECEAIPADLSDPDEVVRFSQEISGREDQIHILVNNAGTYWADEIEDYSIDGFDKVLAVNVRAVFHLTQQLLPKLRAAASPEDPARMIAIGSIDGIRVPLLPTYAYSTSKAAVHMLCRHLAHRLAGDNITVNAIAPGLFKTKMTTVFYSDDAPDFAEVQIPLGRDGRPEDLAGTAIWLASRAGSYLTGAVIPVDGGVSGLL